MDVKCGQLGLRSRSCQLEPVGGFSSNRLINKVFLPAENVWKSQKILKYPDQTIWHQQPRHG